MKKRIATLGMILTLLIAMVSMIAPGVRAAPENAQAPLWSDGKLIYDTYYSEVAGAYKNNAASAGNFPGFDGEGYVFLVNGSIDMNIDVPFTGKYDITVRAANNDNGNRFDAIYINGVGYQMTLVGTEGYQWGTATVGTGGWQDGNYVAAPPAEGFDMIAGSNIIYINADWGYCSYDSITLTPRFTLTVGEKLRMDLYNLPANVTLENKASVEALQARYAALSDTEKAKVENYETLTAALERIALLERLEVQQPVMNGSKLMYEAEMSALTGNAAIENSVEGFSGDGYVKIGAGGFSMRINVPEAGNYHILVNAAKTTDANTCDKLAVNGDTTWLLAVNASRTNLWTECRPGTENWVNSQLEPKALEGGVAFKAGENTLVFANHWDTAAAIYDTVTLVPSTEPIPAPTDPLVELATVEKAQKAIDELPVVPAATDKEAVMAAYAAYNALTETEKKEVINVGRLFAARARILAIEAGDTQDRAMRYEAEEGIMNGNSSVVGADGAIKNYSGGGYVFIFDAGFTLDVYVPEAGRYDIYIIGASDSGEDKSDYVNINGGDKLLTSYLGSNKGKWVSCKPGAEDYLDEKLSPAAPENGYALNAGKNTVEITANWGYSCYDAVVIVPRFAHAENINVNTSVSSSASVLAVVGLSGMGTLLCRPRRRKLVGETHED